jgi:SAM-dependent methyltransferase
MEFPKVPIPKPIRLAAKRMLPDFAISRARKLLNPEGVRWCRVVMDQECDAFMAGLQHTKLTCLEISGEGSRWSRLNWSSYTATAFPEYDVCASPLEGQWDVIIAEQVLEHVPDPQKATDNMFAMLRDGGIIMITTPFLIKFHPFPQDFYRWTKQGIIELLKRSGFGEISAESWGNRSCLIADTTDDNAWTSYRPGRHSLRNDPRFPIVVWAFAHKVAIGSSKANSK